MAHLVLSRKLRPKTFEEVAGQDHIVSALKNSIANNRLGHAYLLAGTRGVGKTTIARIFSRAIRCSNLDEKQNPCGECASCLNSDVDIIEIDGASNNSVDNIRDLISTVQYLPANGPYRVFIIDEVHMLSANAFNALLKTLEEPPEHVKFVFATTDPHKLIDTVLSRCIRFDLRPLSREQLINILNDVVKREELKIDSSKVVELISGCAKGSLRDALSSMEQALSYGEGNSISFQDLEDALGIANLNDVEALINAMIAGKANDVQASYKKIVAKGIFLEQLCATILDQIYEVSSNGGREGFGLSESMWVFETLSKDFVWALESISPFQTVDLILKKVTLRRTFFSESSEVIVSNTNEPSLATSQQNLEPNKNTVPQELPDPQEEIQSVEETAELKKKIIADSLEVLNKKPEEVEGEKPAGPIEPVVPEVELHPDRDMSFQGFLEHVGEFSPAMRTNLQHGNFLTPLKIEDRILEMEIGFKSSAQVFADYFIEKDINDKLSGWSQKYFDVDKVNIKITVVNEEENPDENFQTVNEKIIEAEEIEKKNKQENIQNSDNVRLAEKLFSSKVDKIVLNEKN